MKRLRFWMPLAAALIVGTAVIIAGCASGASSGGGGNFFAGQSWDAEYDVVVVGFGGAGATAAVTAADAGSKVLLLEKAPQGEEGGNTRYAAQLIMIPSDRDQGITYYQALRSQFGNQSDAVVEFIVDGAMGNWDWFAKYGLSKDKFGMFPLVEYPELPGGNESIATYFINDLAEGNAMWTASLFKFLRKLVLDRQDKIDIWYESPGISLIQDKNTKIIHGVVVQRDGKTYNVRAKNGVVLATGGFENNDAMLENFAQLPDAHSKAARYNTGDGIRMAMDVGADLWHMSTLAGSDVNFIVPQTNIAQNYYFASPSKQLNFTGFAATSMLIVGNNGRRFQKETEPGRHGHHDIGGSWISLPIPQNAWCVFDEAARLDRPAYPQWSAGMEEEIAKGWILKANTLQELAALMKIDAAGLAAQVAEYNGYCQAGKDPQYGVEAQYLKPLTRGPYYAFSVSATLTNTQGGPKRNTNCEVLDVWGNPIPHLYSAGEMGSFYVDIYNGGGNLSECLYSGRTAGANAAAVKRDVSSANALRGRAVDFRAEPFNPSLGPNEYLGVGTGMGTEIYLKITYESGRITAVTLLKVNETVGVSDRAIAAIPAAIVAANSADVDIVAGATATSKGIKDAVKDALSKVR
ncbi:FAD-binding dehydrogenase [Spirochaetia bacterium]|nr:FAD-binding dehydrogenase [Spirochaetia bacterium]